MSDFNLKVEIRPSNRPGALRAHADVRIKFPNGTLTLLGFSVIQKDGRPLWVGFPSRQGYQPKMYFPVVEAEGQIRDGICKAILDAYKEAGVQ